MRNLMVSAKTLTRSAIIVFIPEFIAWAAYYFGVLKTIYFVIIVIVCFILETIIFLIFIRKVIKDKRIKGSIMNQMITVPKCKLADKHVRANDDVFKKNVEPIHPWKDSIFRIALELVPDKEKRPLKLYVVRKCESNICEQEIDAINSETKKEVFDVEIDPKEEVNIKFSRDTIIKSLSVDELYMP